MNDKIPGPAVYIYGILNAIILVARIGSIGVAVWLALKPNGSVLAALFVFVLSTFMTPLVYVVDDTGSP